MTTKNRFIIFCPNLVFDCTLFRQSPRILVVYWKWQLNTSKSNSVLKFEKLSTLLERRKAILNSLFITSLSTDTSKLSVLFPEHFLIGNSLTALFNRDETSTFQNRLTRLLRFHSILEKGLF